MAVVLGVLGVLAGCSGGRFFGEREPWRREAEVACINAGTVKEGPGKLFIRAIDGPGMCGADHPIKVSALGEGVPLAFWGEARPPANIPNASMPPQWPGAEPRPPHDASPAYPPPVETRPLGAPGAPPAYEPSDQPFSLEPRAPLNSGAAQPHYRPPMRPAERERIPSLRRRAPPVIAGPISVNPAATLACPLVSALDQWVAGAVQPAATRWFGQPVIELKQISAYACRGMNGNPNARVSEHAFGNALDIAAFTLADGRVVTVKEGWHGAPAEQGFLRDVQGAACDAFSTVLAPGSNAYHYDHIHVDLMRRSSGRRSCEPDAVPGEQVAARARARQAGKRDPLITNSVTPRGAALPAKRAAPVTSSDRRAPLPSAVPGADGDD